MKRDLTDAWLRTLRPPAEGRLEFRDTRVLGLVFRLTPAGTASWSVRARTRNGKQTRPSLGTYPAMGVADARKAALAAIVAVQQGGDPVAAKRQARAARAAQAAEKTVAERLDEWRAARTLDPKSAWSESYAAEIKRVSEQDIGPKLGKRKLALTTRADWTGLITAKRKSAPGMAATLYRMISSFLGYAEAAGWIDVPMLPRKDASALAPMAPPRARVLTEDELCAVWRAADREPPKLRAFLRLLILTGAREGEVAGMAAGEVDRAAATWRIPGSRTKNREGYTVPLCALALAELRAVWPAEPEVPADWRVFGRSGRTPFTGFSRLKLRLDQASGVKEWRFHDLRRTARTGMTRLGVPRDHAEAAINHVSGRSALERTYDRHDYGPEIIAALEKWQAHVPALMANATKGEKAAVSSL